MFQNLFMSVKVELDGLFAKDFEFVSQSPFLTAHKSLIEKSLKHSPKISLKMSQVCLDFVWERLHTGHWSLVSHYWRSAYSFFSTTAALACLSSNSNKLQALKFLDYGIIMGGDVENVLTTLAQGIHDSLEQNDKLELIEVSKEKIDNGFKFLSAY